MHQLISQWLIIPVSKINNLMKIEFGQTIHKNVHSTDGKR